MDPEEVRLKKMNRRAKVIQELIQTEKDYLTDLELCIREVILPLRNLQVKIFKMNTHLLIANYQSCQVCITTATYLLIMGTNNNKL